MTDHTGLVGVIYDTHSLAIRRIVIDAQDLNLHVGPDESLATAPRAMGHSVDRAFEIMRQATGREPPPMAAVHALDTMARNMGSRSVIR